MERRRFLKDLVLTSAGFLADPVWKKSADQSGQGETAEKSGALQIPSLDDLAGDWISPKLFEQTPSICNFRGGIQAGRAVPLDEPVNERKAPNVLAISSFVNFPLAQGGELGQLAVDGTEVVADEYRWCAYQILRRARIHDLEILTMVRMPFEASGILFRIEVTNLGPQPQTADLSVKLRAAIREYPQTWHWDPPRPEDKDSGDFEATVLPSNGGVLRIQDTLSKAVVTFAFVRPAEQLSGGKQEAAWTLDLQPGESRRIEFAMAAGTEPAGVLAQVSSWRADFEQVFRTAKEKWEKRFADAFTPNNGHFSGNLPTLQTADAKLRRLYYMSVLSVLELERTNLHPDFPRVIVTAAPRWAPTLAYFWDTGLFPTLYSLLDPAAVKRLLILFLSADIHSCYAIDVPSEKGVGPWYSFNDYVIFQMVLRYMAVTRDWRFLEEMVAGKRVIDRMEESALHWQRLVKGPSPLASYGTPDNLLETVPTYEQRVPALNAANVWMMRTMAKLRERTGEAARATDLKKQADELCRHVLELYADGKGCWVCELDDGKRVEVRHCVDYFTTIFCIGDDLGEKKIREMTAFVERELWTPDWLYALSPLDGAAKESLRPDHGSTGSFDAWPALTAEAMFTVGQKEKALAHLHNVGRVSQEGPFGQAHFCASDGRPTRKAVSMDYYESSAGAAFAEVILRTIFGFSPGLNDEWTWNAPDCPGLTGQLRNMRYNGKLLERTIGSQKTE